MFRCGVCPSDELNASDGSRPFGGGINGNTSVRSLHRSERDGRIVMIKLNGIGRYGTLGRFVQSINVFQIRSSSVKAVGISGYVPHAAWTGE